MKQFSLLSLLLLYCLLSFSQESSRNFHYYLKDIYLEDNATRKRVEITEASIGLSIFTKDNIITFEFIGKDASQKETATLDVKGIKKKDVSGMKCRYINCIQRGIGDAVTVILTDNNLVFIRFASHTFIGSVANIYLS